MMGVPFPGVRAGTLLVTAFCVVLCACAPAGPAKKVVVLGIDGMDPRLLERFMGEGRLPNLQRLAAEGDVRDLQTTMPPLSPVAWSTFITGMDPGGHGIFDFVHRSPDTLLPYDSSYRVDPPNRRLAVGSFVIPLSGGRVESLRRGRPFWDLLERAGVPTTVFRMPVNFPPVDAGGRSLSGMGTPDILGTHGTFAFYTDASTERPRALSGGVVHRVAVIDHRVDAALRGPANPYRRSPVGPVGGARANRRQGEIEYRNPDLQTAFAVLLDPEEAAARFLVQDTEFVLNEGEWSDWVHVRFEAVPYLSSLGAVGRFYLQQVRPEFRLYVSPLQIDPADPALPISTPSDWSRELHDALGPFHTQELPEETKAFSAGLFSGLEYWEQSQFVYRESRLALDHLLETFQGGLLFMYFSSVDQGSHMLYRFMDDARAGVDPRLVHGVRTLYEQMDAAVGRVLEVVDGNTTLIVMSDHGFAPFERGVNLNSWLLAEGYVTLVDPSRRGEVSLLQGVDWSRTSAYAAGLNGLYVNLEGRERYGIVPPGAAYEQLLDRLEAGLLALRDPRSGRPPVTLVQKGMEAFTGLHASEGPDIVVGYDRGFRSSWENPLGEFPPEVFVDNDDPWGADHAIDRRLVPGVLLTNRRITKEAPALHDLTVAVLDEFGVAPLPDMIGEDTLANDE